MIICGGLAACACVFCRFFGIHRAPCVSLHFLVLLASHCICSTVCNCVIVVFGLLFLVFVVLILCDVVVCWLTFSSI